MYTMYTHAHTLDPNDLSHSFQEMSQIGMNVSDRAASVKNVH